MMNKYNNKRSVKKISRYLYTMYNFIIILCDNIMKDFFNQIKKLFIYRNN